MELKAPKYEEVMKVRDWRNDTMESLRTSFPLTEKMQLDFFEDVVNNRDSCHRYYSLYHDNLFVGFGGLTNIQWENRCAEISLIIDPLSRKKNYGSLAVSELLKTAFNSLNLNMVFGEVYTCNKALDFWKKMASIWNCYTTTLYSRKFWDGKYYDSLYFSVDKRRYENQQNDFLQ
jgi:hypothetical protein